MRGYGGSDRPDGVESYSVPKLVGDVAGLIAALGRTRALVVGHDWGGVVAWWTAMLRPDVVERLGIVNALHPEGYSAALHTPEQARRSWYVFFFQTPLVPEVALRAHDFHYGCARSSSPTGSPATRSTAASTRSAPRERSKRPSPTTAPRCATASRERPPKSAVISVPVMVVWGMKASLPRPLALAAAPRVGPERRGRAHRWRNALDARRLGRRGGSELRAVLHVAHGSVLAQGDLSAAPLGEPQVLIALLVLPPARRARFAPPGSSRSRPAGSCRPRRWPPSSSQPRTAARSPSRTPSITRPRCGDRT